MLHLIAPRGGLNDRARLTAVAVPDQNWNAAPNRTILGVL